MNEIIKNFEKYIDFIKKNEKIFFIYYSIGSILFLMGLLVIVKNIKMQESNLLLTLLIFFIGSLGLIIGLKINYNSVKNIFNSKNLKIKKNAFIFGVIIDFLIIIIAYSFWKKL